MVSSKMPEGSIQVGVGRHPSREVAEHYASMEQVFSHIIEKDPDDVKNEGGYRVVYFKKPGQK